jgi:hypothetical protein
VCLVSRKNAFSFTVLQTGHGWPSSFGVNQGMVYTWREGGNGRENRPNAHSRAIHNRTGKERKCAPPLPFFKQSCMGVRSVGKRVETTSIIAFPSPPVPCIPACKNDHDLCLKPACTTMVCDCLLISA